MTSLYSHRWTGAEKDLLGRVMDYWARLPDVRHGAIWVWFVCIIYQRSVAPPFRWLKTRFRIWAEHRIRASIRAMAKARVGVLFVAPELQSVDRADLDDWVAGCDKRRFDVAGLGPAVRVSFDGFAAAIPMDHVAFKLRALLKDYQKPNDGDRP
jgi:hypothetical protein